MRSSPRTRLTTSRAFFTGGEPGRARDTKTLGVPFGQVFAAAKQFTHASLG